MEDATEWLEDRRSAAQALNKGDHETICALILKYLPQRFAVWSPAASAFVEEIAWAAEQSGLQPATLFGANYDDAPYATDNPEQVEAFKQRLEGWLIATYERDTKTTIEAVVGAPQSDFEEDHNSD